MKYVVLMIFYLLFVSCNKSKSPTTVDSQTEVNNNLEESLELPQVEVVLLPEAREITNDWLAYITAQSEIDNFSTYTLSDVMANATPIAEIMQSLRQTVPMKFQTNAVETRMSVLYTKARILEHLSKKKSPQAREIAKTAEEIPIEFNNFKIQLNEIFEKTLEDFEEELNEFEQYESIPDTLSREERKPSPPINVIN